MRLKGRLEKSEGERHCLRYAIEVGGSLKQSGSSRMNPSRLNQLLVE